MTQLSRRQFMGGALAGFSLGATAAATRALAVSTGVSPSVRVSRDHYNSHTEPCLAINPRDPRNMLAACELPLEMATYVSFDGGGTWRSNGRLPLPAGSPGGGNVSAAFDGDGRAFVCGLLEEAGGQRGAYLWRSDDRGQTFAAPVKLGAGPMLDRPWLAVESGSSQALHVVWANGSGVSGTTALGYTRSADGGRSFGPPRTIARMPAGLGNPMIACGAAGAVYVIYGAGRGALETATDVPMAISVVCSRDGGQTFSRPTELGRGEDLITFPEIRLGPAGSSRPARNSSLPAIAADPVTGLVCVVYTVHRAGARHAAVMLTASHDDGRSWSAPTRITPPGQVIYFEPQVAIERGRIGVTAFAAARGLVSVVLMQSAPGSLRLSAPITVTEKPFNPVLVADPNGRLQLGDYQALAATQGAFHPLWNDARAGSLQLYTAAVRAR